MRHEFLWGICSGGVNRISDFGFGTSGKCRRWCADEYYGGCTQAGKNNGVRDAGCGKVAALMRRKYIWGFYTDECEKPVQVETFKAPQAWGAVCEAD